MALDLSKLTPDVAKKLQRIEAEIAAKEAYKQRLLNRVSPQQRKDDTRRAIILGQLLQKHAATEKSMAAVVNKLIGEHWPEKDRYLWPDRWPDAQRGVKTKQ